MLENIGQYYKRVMRKQQVDAVRSDTKNLPTTLYQLRTHKTFTLIEILIASAIFTAIVVLSVGSFTDSISFNSSAGQERIVRSAAQTFLDFMTLQLRQSSSSQISITTVNDYQVASGTPATWATATDPYSGTGYLLINGFSLGGAMKLADLTSGGGATGIIFPITPDSAGNSWFYIGMDPALSSCNAGAQCYGVWRAQPQKPGNVADYSLLTNRAAMNWQPAGQFLPSEVSLTTLAMSLRGINPQGTTFDSTGVIKGYSVPAQPYVTIAMQLAPLSDPTTISSYQTTITSRDYKFAFPQCSKNVTPAAVCN